MSIASNRIKEFESMLQADLIKLEHLQKLCFNGIPDERGLRPLCWKLLLSYLPLDVASRVGTLKTKRTLYKQFIDEIIVSPGGENDHPLNVSPDSSWSTYFKDNEVLLQIDKDVRRLCPDISFFQTATEFPCDQVVNSSGVKRLHKRVEHSALFYSDVERKGLGPFKISRERGGYSSNGSYESMSEGNEAHWEVVERILFIYAKLNPGQGYVQGMNEIVGPIYHTFATDPDIAYREYAEADCFFCFTNLMSEIRDFFIKSLDESEGGVNHLIQKFDQAIRLHDSNVLAWWNSI
ncbi:TBC1 domain family member 13-like [Arctopsyche grandis]|uniref:TBC1 domain family member 13-like n=1 Tax=Arctopsyche grandis TaxID=121162 RepID=UPI00406D9AAF